MPYDASLNFVFWSSTKIVFGEKTALDAAIEVENLKCKKALIVTDRDLAKKGSWQFVRRNFLRCRT
jgi:alcohol dehydrogenase class IV